MKYFVLQLVLFVYCIGIGQNVLWKDTVPPKRLERQVEKIFRSQLKPFDNISSIDLICQSYGYVNCSISIDSSTNCLIQLGPRYTWKKVKVLGIDSFSFFSKNDFSNFYDPINFSSWIKGIEKELLNNGYPFYTIAFQEIEFDNTSISATMQVDKGRFIQFGKIEIIGSSNIGNRYIQGLSGIKYGDPFNKDAIELFLNNLNRLNFVKVTREAEFLLNDDKVDIRVYIDNKSINQFQGLIGFQKDPNTNQSIALNGYLDMYLKNILNHGSDIDFHWKSMGAGSQNAQLDFSYPYILGLNIGADYGINFSKIDSSFLNVQNSIGLNYQFGWQRKIGIGIDLYESIVSGYDLEEIRRLGTLPVQLSRYSRAYFIEALIDSRNDILFTKSGIYLNPKISFVNSHFKPDASILDLDHPEIDFTKSFDSLGLKQSILIDISMLVAKSIKKHTFSLHSRGYYHNISNRMESDGIFLGGINNLIGYNELDHNLIHFISARIKYQYYFDKKSAVGLMSDNIMGKVNLDDSWLNLYGIGGVLDIGTKSGKFSLIYAVGNNENGNLNFRDSKLHFSFRQYL